MAIIIPYGDAQAHGSLAGSVTFRRHRGKVVFQKKPHGKISNTPGQLAQQQKFKDGWSSYHTLNAWEIDYLNVKASQLGTTPSNLYMSQYLKDEIPSTDPMSRIKEILDASLPEVVDSVDEGIKNDFINKTNIGDINESLGFIWDKENIWNPDIVSGAYDITRIQLSRIEVDPINIPLDYPIIITWKDFSDVIRTQLIRYPALTINETAPASTTPMTDIKKITNLQLMDKFGTVQFQYGFVFGTFNSISSEEKVLGIIDDNSDTFIEMETVGTYDNFWIECQDNLGAPTTIPDDYTIRMTWDDMGDVEHIDDIRFSEFTNADGGAFSTTPMASIKQWDDGKIPFPIGSKAQASNSNIAVEPIAPPGGIFLGSIWDTENIFNVGGSVANPLYTTHRLSNDEAFTLNVPDNYRIFIRYKNPANMTKWAFMYHESKSIPTLDYIPVWLADDFSLYSEIGLTNIIGKARKNTKRLWVADDFSVYNDMALTSLNHAGKDSPTDLWLANDFSLYYDQALTQLASTPFF